MDLAILRLYSPPLDEELCIKYWTIQPQSFQEKYMLIFKKNYWYAYDQLLI